MPPAAVSDRGEQIRHRLESGMNMRHITDVRGAMGCYFCWLGQYDKCQKFCQKVHVTPSDTNLTQGSRGPTTTGYLNNRWDAATPYFTAAATQQRSMFDESQALRAVSPRSRNITPGEFVSGVHIPFAHGPESHLAPRGHRYEHAAAASAAGGSRSGSPSASSRREKHGIHSLHQPIQSHPLYKHPRGAEWIQATEHTRITVTPSTHCYLAHHKKYVPRDGSAIWSGTLVKNGEVADDERSRSIQAQRRRGRSLSASSSRYGGRNGSSYLRVTEEEQLSRIASGTYHDAFEMPLPGIFNERT